MKIHSRLPLLLVLLLHLHTYIFLNSASTATSLNLSDSNSNDNARLLQDVLKEIAAEQKWDLRGMRILKLDIENVRFGCAESYEILLGFGKTQLLAKFSDEVSSWKKPSNLEASFGSLIEDIVSMAALRTFKIAGPFDLTIEGDDPLSLSLPMNASYGSLKRILVGEGITVEISEAEEISVFYSSDFKRLVNQTRINKRNINIFPFSLSFCLPLLPIRVSSSATLTAYRTRNPDDHIETAFLSDNTVELLPDKCYGRNDYTKNSPMADSLESQFSILETVLESFLSSRILQNALLAFVKVTMRASAVVRFQLEIESKVGKNSRRDAKLAEWRTRPTAERALFEVLAGADAVKLKPLMIKKLKPLMVTDSAEWRNWLPNISFTKFPSLLVPPEALTLDVKW